MLSAAVLEPIRRPVYSVGDGGTPLAPIRDGSDQASPAAQMTTADCH